MEISFCDRCDASIPRADLDRGAARELAGALLCASCVAARRRGRAALLALAPLALLAAAAVGAAAAVWILRPRIESLETEVAGLRGEAEAPRTDPALLESLKEILEVDRGQSRAIAELREALLANARDQSEAARELSDHVVHLADEVRKMKEHLARAVAPAPAEPGGTEEAPVPPAVDLDAWLPRVDDPDAGVRLSALLALAPSPDARVTEKLLGVLEDPDWVVRAQAVRLLGERKAERAIPALIGLLSDRSVGVRRAAQVALTALTGRDHGYDATDPEEDREKAVKAIRDWWEKR